MNDSNLKKGEATQFKAGEEQAKIARLGGIASGVAKRRRKAIDALVHDFLDKPLSDEQRQALLDANPHLAEEDAVVASAMINAQVTFATRAKVLNEESGRRHYVCSPSESINAFKALAEMDARAMSAQGDETRQAYRMSALDMTTDCVAPYRDIHRFFDGEIDLDDVVLRGGRGGIKSTFAAHVAYEVMEQDANANVVFGRRFASDLRHTVYTAFVRLLGEMGVAEQWEITKSPLRCTRRESGTSAYFFGFDNAEQLKSFQPEAGYVKLLVFEEADEMMGDEQMDSAADTFLRANGYEGARQLRMKVFNPPPSRHNFMNVWCAEHVGDPRVRVFDFSYLNVPPEWLGQSFLDRAARAREERPEWYRNNYLGEVTGEGGELFGNVVEREITDDERWRLLELSHQGLDFGYEHPQAFVRVAYEPEHDRVTVLDEVVRRRCRLDAFMDEVAQTGASIEGRHYVPMQNEVICDSAEPDRIAELRDWGWDAIGSVKRWKGGGRAYSWDWLRQRREIAVDPSRTPHVASELRSLEFERVRDGFTSRYPDVGEDGVMAIIYALNRVIRRDE